jgi:hypothetical protein
MRRTKWRTWTITFTTSFITRIKKRSCEILHRGSLVHSKPKRTSRNTPTPKITRQSRGWVAPHQFASIAYANTTDVSPNAKNVEAARYVNTVGIGPDAKNVEAAKYVSTGEIRPIARIAKAAKYANT